MKIQKLNISLVDVSENQDARIWLVEIPEKGDIVAKLSGIIEELERRGVTEIEEMNVTVLDLSNSERTEIK